ncbi:MAG: helix-hairpin-helix domain-containing protein, partial [Candidatus Goldbacteria bacterium]|nr:helix-hairpin-helix domain-containing protein [Candidatus Goldiibacteriota bacterium]
MFTKEEKTILIIILVFFITGIITYFLTSYNKKIKREIISTGKININKAKAEELEKLPGIGKTIAQRIIEYREKNKGFKSLEEIKNI